MPSEVLGVASEDVRSDTKKGRTRDAGTAGHEDDDDDDRDHHDGEVCKDARVRTAETPGTPKTHYGAPAGGAPDADTRGGARETDERKLKIGLGGPRGAWRGGAAGVCRGQ